MEPISTDFTEGRFRYVQRVRTGDLAIYSQEHLASKTLRYEVIRIRIQREHTWSNGAVMPEQEAYPGSKFWGRYGFTCFTFDEAQKLLARL